MSRAHLHHLNPFPRISVRCSERFEQVLVPELNSGQLALLLQGRFLKRVISYPKVQGKPFFRHEIFERIQDLMGSAK